MIPFRKSSYLIDIPLDNGNGKHMFIHGYTGAIDIAGSDVANLLKMRGPISKDNSNIPRETFDALVQRGYLTQKTVEEEREFCKRWANFLHLWKKRFALRTFMFMVTYDCNFRRQLRHIAVSDNKLVAEMSCFLSGRGNRTYMIAADLNTGESKAYLMGEKTDPAFPLFDSGDIEGYDGKTVISSIYAGSAKKKGEEYGFEDLAAMSEYDNPVLVFHTLNY